MCTGSTVARALKSVLQGILLSSEGENLNSMNLLLYMAPVAVVILLPATMIIEANVVGITIALARKDVNIVWYLLFNSAMAYCVNLTNFLVTNHTSALTLQNAIKNMDDKKQINGESPAVVFKIHLHCERCARNAVSSILHFEGVESVNVDMAGNKIMVMGKVDPARVKEGIENKARKKVEILSAPRKKVQFITVC